MKRIKEGLFLLMIVCWCFVGVKVKAADTDNRVLFISSYSYAWEQVQSQIKGIQDGLGEECTLDYEFMDTKRVDDETSLQLFHDGLAYRLAHVAPYDAVIVGDDAALVFAMNYQEELFEGIPIIFEGINNEEYALEAASDPLVTGVLEKLSVDKNVELGLKLNPDAKKVVAILDDTITGEAERKRFYNSAPQYPNLEFSEINTSQLTTTGLYRALTEVTDDSILIYVVMTEDASGKQYTNSQAIRMITSAAKVPTLRMVEGGVGEGLLGGNVASMYRSGEMAAKMALDFINGTNKYVDGAVADSPNVYCVDAQMMEKFDISLSVLPEDTEIINYEMTFFQRNKETLVPGCILIGALVIIIVWVGVDNRRRRKLLQELGEAKKIVEAASEHDFLTGIPNRNKFMGDLNRIVASKTPCTIMMIDIDDFKIINDTLGHTAGDDALRQVAARLKEMESQILTPYRFAGDEFILILKSSQAKIVEKTAYQCRQVFSKPFSLCGNQARVCGSIGIASYPNDTEDPEQLIIYADDAMYHVKKSGKNDFAFYDKRKLS
ncbi:MAG: ABC transporter substrate binding protein [Acetatifactor sp.]